MAFVKKTWKDRIVQYANRRLLTKSGGEVEQVTVTRDEGAISEAGDQFNASNMNDLENRVKDAFDNVDTALSDKANSDDLARVATSGSYSDLQNIPNNIFRCAYYNTASVTVYEIDYDYLAGISRRTYGMAIVSAWKDIFALHYNSDNTIFIVPLTPNPQRTVTCEWVSSTRKIKLTFSGQVWSGIAVYPM